MYVYRSIWRKLVRSELYFFCKKADLILHTLSSTTFGLAQGFSFPLLPSFSFFQKLVWYFYYTAGMMVYVTLELNCTSTSKAVTILMLGYQHFYAQAYLCSPGSLLFYHFTSSYTYKQRKRV